MSNNQLPAEVQDRIKADAKKYASDQYGIDTEDINHYAHYQWSACAGHYIAGATAEAILIDDAIDNALHAERNKMQVKFSEADKQWAALLKQREDKAQVLADALENAKTHIHDLCMTIIRLGYTPYNPISEINEALQQWKEGKEPRNAKEGIIRVILAGVYDVSKDAASAEEYLKAEGVNVAKIKANAQYFTWKAELIKIAKEKTGESVVKINDAEAVKWYNDGFTPEQTFRETWQSDGD